jgi:PilZ domain
VDPHVSPEPSGLTPESPHAEGGATYLRRLKTQVEGADAPAAASSADAAAESAPFTGKERRQGPRYRCAGSAEFKAEGSDVRMWGTLTDISLHGCYVEMSTTFPVGTKVDLTLEALGIRVRALGVIRVSYPFLGMGISLTEIDPGQQTQLEQLLAALAGENPVPAPTLAPVSTLETVAAAEPVALLDGIRHFFESNKNLPREQFLEIARSCRRRF